MGVSRVHEIEPRRLSREARVGVERPSRGAVAMTNLSRFQHMTMVINGDHKPV
jgi:hypothetical protein